jgi:hypothetical protein
MDNEIISEKRAWEIIDEFVNDLIQLDQNSLLAVYVIGSLGGGYYRPGKSDIDTIVIVKNDAVVTQEEVDRIATGYWHKYHIPKGFGSIVAAERDLVPPYQKSEDFDFEFSMEIVRLKLQGKAVYGSYDLSKILMPTKNDLIHDALIMENWFDREFGIEMFDKLEYVGCVNTILSYFRRYLMVEKDIFILNKFCTIETYCSNEPPIVDHDIFTLINETLKGYEAKSNELDMLRRFGNQIRPFMNKRLLNRLPPRNS